MTYVLVLALVLLNGACTWAAPNNEDYVQAYKDVLEAENILTDKILSMAGNVPLLNDSRRQYAEIVYVIYNISSLLSSCDLGDIRQKYQLIVNQSVPEAISNPLKVVQMTKDLVDDFNAKTLAIRTLINTTCNANTSAEHCNEEVGKIVKERPEINKESDLFLTGGMAANIFNFMADEFDKVTKSLHAHQYIIRGFNLVKTMLSTFPDVAVKLKCNV